MRVVCFEHMIFLWYNFARRLASRKLFPSRLPCFRALIFRSREGRERKTVLSYYSRLSIEIYNFFCLF